MQILIVNSNEEVVKRLQLPLERLGHHVRTAAGVAQALPLLEAQRADVLVVECQQLELHGAPLFRLLGRWPQPAMVLPTPATLLLGAGWSAALAGQAERLQAVAAQAQALLTLRDEGVLGIGDLAIDMTTKRVTFRGRHVALPPIQFRLLAYLAQHAGRVVGAQELLRAVWGYEDNETEARELVKVHVRQIRRRLGLEAHRADYVQSVRGFGYVVTAPSAENSNGSDT